MFHQRHRRTPFGARLEAVARGQRLDSGEQDVFRRIARKTRPDRLGVLGRFEAIQSEKRLQLRREREPTGTDST